MSVPRLPFETLFLHLTRRCQLQCAGCYLCAHPEADTADELSAEALTALAPQIVALAPAKLVLTGGEPLLRPDLLVFLQALDEADPAHRVRRCLNTNGLLLTASVARLLVGLVDEVRVSVDALQPRNDRLRGPGSFEAAWAALLTLRGVGFEPTVMITASSESLPDLPALVRALWRAGFRALHLNPLRPIGRADARPDWAAPLELIRRRFDEALAALEDPPARAPAPKVEHCGAGYFLNIMPNGDTYPCHVLRHRDFFCGSLWRQSLGELCAPGGLLGRLRALDFGALGLSKAEGLCLGYADHSQVLRALHTPMAK